MILTFFIAFLALAFSVFSMASFSAHSAVYFIILSFLSTGLVYYIVGSTYVSIMLFIVYVGAVAMLFIFCVMLLNLKNLIRAEKLKYYLYFPILLLSAFFIVYAHVYYFQLSTAFYYFDWPAFSYNYYSKDHMFLSTFYTMNSAYIMIIGLLLFFVTVAVTALLSLFL
jgi:NADH:ubiquinone oxidoreductase subunit 6 (subunit J)